MGHMGDQTVLKRWLRQARKVGATALLLEPPCSHTWFCYGAGYGGGAGSQLIVKVPQRYAAEAIAVEGAACLMPSGLCRMAQPTFVSFGRQMRANRSSIPMHRLVGLSVRLHVSGIRKGNHLAGIGSILSIVRRHETCPMLRGFGIALGAPPPHTVPVIPMTAMVPVSPDGRTDMKELTFTQLNGNIVYVFGLEDALAGILAHWRFEIPSRGARSFELIMNWHLNLLKPGHPIPPGVVCWYPPYPVRHWKGGVMVHHLKWTLYGGKNHALWAWIQ